MELLPNSPAPIQLNFPFPNVVPALPDPTSEELILPRHLWATLTSLQREQLRQHLRSLLQEVFHASDRC